MTIIITSIYNLFSVFALLASKPKIIHLCLRPNHIFAANIRPFPGNHGFRAQLLFSLLGRHFVFIEKLLTIDDRRRLRSPEGSRQ